MVLYAIIVALYNLSLFYILHVPRINTGTYLGYLTAMLIIVLLVEFVIGILIVIFDIESGFIWGVFTTKFYDYDVEDVKEFISFNLLKLIIICISLFTVVLVSTIVI